MAEPDRRSVVSRDMGSLSVWELEPSMVHPTNVSDDRLLFCPFCRECYEGERVCPVHELELVEFQDLPRQAHERSLPGWDERVRAWDPRFGRAWIALGVLGCAVGFLLPLVQASAEQASQSWSGLELATSRGRNLWTIPFSGAMFVFFLLRRRTPRQMFGARLVAVILSVMPVVSLAYSLWNVQRFAADAAGAVAVGWGSGVWVLAASSVLLLVGSIRFGGMPTSGELPHGSEPDRPDTGIEIADSSDAPPS